MGLVQCGDSMAVVSGVTSDLPLQGAGCVPWICGVWVKSVMQIRPRPDGREFLKGNATSGIFLEFQERQGGF